MSNPRLECHGLRKSFTVRGQPLHVLKDISFSAAPGETVVISGRSGQGKSVLLWLLSGIDRPDAGEIIFDGERLDALPPHALASLRRERIGLIFQNFNLIESWTALENVQAALLNSSRPPREQRDASAALLARLDLSDRLDNLPCQLSVGQQQRVAVARALVTSPSLLLADEPSGDVDPETAEHVLALLSAYVTDRQATMVVATHGTYTPRAADRVFRLADGTLRAQQNG